MDRCVCVCLCVAVNRRRRENQPSLMKGREGTKGDGVQEAARKQQQRAAACPLQNTTVTQQPPSPRRLTGCYQKTRLLRTSERPPQASAPVPPPQVIQRCCSWDGGVTVRDVILRLPLLPGGSLTRTSSLQAFFPFNYLTLLTCTHSWPCARMLARACLREEGLTHHSLSSRHDASPLQELFNPPFFFSRPKNQDVDLKCQEERKPDVAETSPRGKCEK